jgi:serine/threonine-protein kinase
MVEGRMIGKQIGNYRIIGPAVPWFLADWCLALDTRKGGVVDMILLSPDAAGSAAAADEFLTGMRVALDFRHPGFVHLLDCDRLTDGTVYLVREHVEAECLSERLKRQGELASDLATVCDLVAQTAAAMGAAHQAGLLYLCLRPENILLLPASQAAHLVTVRLLELGMGSHFLSRIRQMAPGKELPASLLCYCSPEQCLGGSVDPRSDIYSLGCVLFELFVGQRPFKQTDLWSLVSAHAHNSPARLRELRPELSPALEDLVAAMLEKDPTRRPFAMAEVVAVLRAFVSQPVPSFEPSEAPSPPALARTVLLEPELPVSDSDALPSADTSRPTRLLPPAEEVSAPQRPAVVPSPHRVQRDQSPPSAELALAGRRSRHSMGKGAGTKRLRSSWVAMLVGIAFVCVALGAGLLLWSRPQASKAQRALIEETTPRQRPISPPVSPGPALAPAGERPTPEVTQPARDPADKTRSDPEKSRRPAGRTKGQDPARPRVPDSPDGILEPTFR